MEALSPSGVVLATLKFGNLGVTEAVSCGPS